MPHQSPGTRILLSLAWSAFLFLAFVIAGGWILLVANGYVVNWQTGSVTQTSAIVLAGQPSAASVTLDGLTVSPTLPITLRNVTIGSHIVQVTATDYQSWRLSTQTTAGQAIIRDQIELFLQKPVEVTPAPAAPENALLIDPTLAVNNTELYQIGNGNQQLITRFSAPILAAVRSNDRAHVFVQLGNAIYVTELTGENTTKLLDLPDASPVKLVPQSNDQQLVVLTGNTTHLWQIR